MFVGDADRVLGVDGIFIGDADSVLGGGALFKGETLRLFPM
jgi:hypothetical protein